MKIIKVQFLTWLLSVSTSLSIIHRSTASFFSAEIAALIIWLVFYVNHSVFFNILFVDHLHFYHSCLNLFVPVGFFQVFDARRTFSTTTEYLKIREAFAVSSVTEDPCEVHAVANNSRVSDKRVNDEQELSHPQETSTDAVMTNSFVSVKDSLFKEPIVRLMSPASFIRSQHTATVHLPSPKIWLKQ